MNLRLIGWYVLAVAAGLAVVFGFPALGVSIHRDPLFPVRTAWCMAALVCQIGAAWYFLSNLAGFKRGLRTVYILLSVGIMSLGLAQLQLPLLTYWDAWASWYAISGLVLLPYLVTSLAMYASMRRFGRLMDLRSAWMKAWVVVLLSVAGIAVTVGAFMRLETSVTTVSYDALIGWSEAMGLATVVVAYRVRGTLTPTLRPAMNWLIVSFLIMMAAGLQQLWLQHFTAEGWWFRYQGWLYWALLGASMTFLKTGLVFRKLTQGLAVTANPLDVVMYAAGLVSRPQDVDEVLERLRRLTASLAPGVELTNEQRQELMGIYLDLERYLVTGERLRKLSVTSLRVSLPDSFVAQLPAAA